MPAVTDEVPTSLAPATTTATTIAPDTTVAESTSTTDTSTPVDSRPIDPEDQALALAGLLQADSFAPPWTVFSEGGPDVVSTESCSYRPDGAVTYLTNGASQTGPTIQLNDTGAFVSSYTVAFPDEAFATEYIGIVNTDDWAPCRAAQLQQFQTDNGYDFTVTVATRESSTLHQNGFDSYAEFDITAPDGSIGRIVTTSFYRIGREVIVVNQEYSSLADADFTKFFDDAYAALVNSYDRVNALE